MIEVRHKQLPGGRHVFYRIEGNSKDGFVSMASLDGEEPADKVHSKEQPTRADVEDQFGAYVRGKQNQA